MTEQKFTQQQLEHDGYSLLKGIYAPADLQSIIHQLSELFQQDLAAIRHRAGGVYAMRNVLTLWPQARKIARQPQLQQILRQILGEKYGLVRGLYFDKPPEQTWSLPWHKDLLIAVKAESIQSSCYSVPRLRMGVPHTEPPLNVLQAMVTARIHLDDMTAENGPLEVLPGSHKTGKTLQMQDFSPVKLTCRAGDVLLMRPLLAHASGKSLPNCQQHRRILHLEFSSLMHLPHDAEWWEFYPHCEATADHSG